MKAQFIFAILIAHTAAYPGWQSGAPTCQSSGCTNQHTPCLDNNAGTCLPRTDPTYNVTKGQCRAGTTDCCCTSGCCCLNDLPCMQLNDFKCMPKVDPIGAFCKYDKIKGYDAKCVCSPGTKECKEDGRTCPTPPPRPPPTRKPTPKPTPAPTPCKKAVDVAFVLDSSASIGASNWQVQLNGAAKIVDGLEVAASKVHVAAATFSKDGQIAQSSNHFKLTEHMDDRSVEAAIKRFRWLRQHTATGPALEWVKRNIWTQAAGARPGVNKVTIIITDGHANEGVDPKIAAAELKRQGIRVIAIGVGNTYDRRQLADMASTPSSEYVFTLKTYDVTPIIAEVLKISCK